MGLLPDGLGPELSVSDPRFKGLEHHYLRLLDTALGQVESATGVKDLWESYSKLASEFRRESRWYSEYSRQVHCVDRSLRTLDSTLRHVDRLEQENERFRAPHLREADKETLRSVLAMNRSTDEWIDAMSESLRLYLHDTARRGRQVRRTTERKLFWFRFRSQYLRFIETSFYGLILCTLLIAWLRGALLEGGGGLGALVLWYFVKKYWIDPAIEKRILIGEKRRLRIATVYLHRARLLGEWQTILLHDHVLHLKERIVETARGAVGK